MFPIFTIFLIFVVVLNIALRRQSRSQEEVDKRFWDQELEANNTRKQDISGLDYLTIPVDKIPQNLGTESEKALLRLASEKMLNLTGQTNTDLKRKYGIANLEILSEYEANFTAYVSALSAYTAELIEDGQRDAARELLELAIAQRADSCTVYTRLARLYCEDGQAQKVQDLIDKAQTFDSISGRIIVGKLKELFDADGFASR